MAESDPSSRRAVEAKIAAEEMDLLEVVRLLRDEVPFLEWPPRLREALAKAIDPGDTPKPSPGELWKAAALRRHLFRGDDPAAFGLDLDGAGSTDVAPLSERLRGSLTKLVGLGAGHRRTGTGRRR